MLASVVISTYNRADALEPTLSALACQDLAPHEYEVLVIDDGSTDTTQAVLAAAHKPYALRTFRQVTNSGVSAGRNVGLLNARGEYIIMISDDLIVPENFISTHIVTLKRFANTWVVGGFSQLDTLTQSSFGRFLDELERQFERGRTGAALAPDIYAMAIPTARNLSLPRTDLKRIGLFDEQFRVTCEDQDLANRATAHGIRFLYNASLNCIHNDAAADLQRYCRFQQRGARDTVRLLAKYPELYGRAPIAKFNGYARLSDGPEVIARKVVKRLLAVPPVTSAIERLVRFAEGAHLPDHVLARTYRLLIGIYTFRGFREGLAHQPTGPPSSRPLITARLFRRTRNPHT